MGLIDNEVALVQRRAITWTNVYPVPWWIYAALEGDELNDTGKCIDGKVEDNSSSVMMWLSTFSKKNGWIIPSILSQNVNTLIIWTIENHRERPTITPSISSCEESTQRLFFMMTSANGNAFRVTGHFCGEFTGLRWIPRTKAGDAELWFFLWSALNKRLSKQW